MKGLKRIQIHPASNPRCTIHLHTAYSHDSTMTSPLLFHSVSSVPPHTPCPPHLCPHRNLSTTVRGDVSNTPVALGNTGEGDALARR